MLAVSSSPGGFSREPCVGFLPAHWRSILSLTTGHQKLLQDCLAQGLRRAAAALADTSAAGTRLDLHAVRSVPISELALESFAPLDDVIAGVCQRFHGGLTGTALLALDPGDALLWLQLGGASPDPLARFVDLGSRVVSHVLLALAASGGTGVELGPASLEERPALEALLRTHAPSDTIVLCLEGEILFSLAESGSALHAPFSIHILLQPKLLHGILSSLLVGG